MFARLTSHYVLLAAATIVIVQAPMFRGHAQQDIVSDKPITERDLEQRSKLKQLRPGNAPSRDEVVEELRAERRKVQEAGKFGVTVSASEVDDVYATMAGRMRMTAEQLTQSLVRAGVNVETLKDRIRADLAWQRYQERRRKEPPRLWQDALPRDRNG